MATVRAMSRQSSETLTAAMRRLADERASGLVSVTTPGGDVVIELADGAPVAIGPVHDVRHRIGDDAPAALVAATVVDDLVDRTVAAVVAGDTTWAWDVSSDAALLPVPDGLTGELARRAVDAAQALAALDPGDVLEPARAVTTTGDLDRVRQLFDGARTLEGVATRAELTVPRVATMAAALVAGGALAHDDEDDEPARMSWTDTVAAADHQDDEDDDDPEPWVMDPPTDEAADVGPDVETDARHETEQGPDGEADTRVEPADDAETATTANWNDTSWLDELAASPDEVADDVSARTALSSLLNDLEDDDLFGPGASGDQPDAPARTADPEPVDDAVPPAGHPKPKAEPGDVAEFLRELSRLALDDD